MAIADAPDASQVFHADRLSASAVIRDGDHDQRNAIASNFGNQFLQSSRVHIAFERVAALWVTCLGDQKVHRLSSAVFDVGASSVEMGVVGNNLAYSANKFEENSFARPTLMRRQNMLKPGDLLNFFLEYEEAAGTRIRLIPAHHPGPLFGRHGARAAVREQVDDDIFRPDQEDVHAGRLQYALTLRRIRHANWLDHLDAKRFD